MAKQKPNEFYFFEILMITVLTAILAVAFFPFAPTKIETTLIDFYFNMLGITLSIHIGSGIIKHILFTEIKEPTIIQ